MRYVDSSELRYVNGQTRFEVGRFILVDHIVLRKLVQHGRNRWKHLCRFLGVRGCPQRTNGISGRFVLVTITSCFRAIGTNALQ